ncbi:glycosyltransferase family 2 protein [Halorussus litoreus]|uniref:glycosyltransferase family 2 protein n=1 Tax=Halorussus litoreus TaxID=1710536 RepID=UPI000E25C9D8|nr:glycosyltransferase family A protein [Halorussus litoreus]
MRTVSVVVPTYERGDVLPRALDSALAQTHPDLEILVVDDGSTDATAETVAKYRARDDRVRYLVHEDNRGPSAARNTGIEAAEGEVVAFLDSDDELRPRFVERSVAVLDETPENCVGTYVAKNVRRDGDLVRVLDAAPTITAEALASTDGVDWDFVRAGGMAVEADVLDEIGGFDEEIRYHEDYDLWLRLAERSYVVEGIDEPLYDYHLHGDQLTDSPGDALFEGTELLLEKQAHNLSGTLEARYRYVVAHDYARRGDFEAAAREFQKAIAANPRRLMNYYYYATSKLSPRAFEIPLYAVSIAGRLNDRLFRGRSGPLSR